MTTDPAEQKAAELTLQKFANILRPFNPLAGLDDTPTEPTAQPLHRWIIPLLATSFFSTETPLSIDAVRAELVEKLHGYANSGARAALLVAAPAGIGKSHAAIEFVQERAAMGERWYWAAQNHAMFDDLAAQPNFKPEFWYHWQPLSGTIDGDAACKFAARQETWTAKGYKTHDLCLKLCGDNGENPGGMAACPFRTQAARAGSITFIMHQHLLTGLDDPRLMTGIIVDESFVSLLAREKYIPGDQLHQTGAGMKIAELADILVEIREGIRNKIYARRVSGRALWDAIGSVYPDALAHLDAIRQAEEMRLSKTYLNPSATHADTINDLQTLYIPEFLDSVKTEFQAWQVGLSTWAERSWMDKDGLHYVAPAPVWDGLPNKVIVLDATGREEFFKIAFNRATLEYRPNAARRGRVYQVVGKLNNKGIMLDKNGKPSKAVTEFIETARAIIERNGYKNIAVITHKDVVPFIRDGLGLEDNQVMHFYALRGRNDLKDCDAVFVFGTPSPSERTVTNIMLALDPRRIEPIYRADENGDTIPVFVPMEQEFRFSENGLAKFQAEHGEQYHGAARIVGGYKDKTAAAIHGQMREAELLQAVYRARLLTNPAAVWVFSAIPLDIELDGLYQEEPSPAGIPAKTWKKISQFHEAQAAGTVYGYTELVQGTGISLGLVKHIKALDAIAEWYDDAERTSEKISGVDKPRAIIRKGVK